DIFDNVLSRIESGLEFCDTPGELDMRFLMGFEKRIARMLLQALLEAEMEDGVIDHRVNHHSQFLVWYAAIVGIDHLVDQFHELNMLLIDLGDADNELIRPDKFTH
ncbi:MAG: hypothetical protein Q8L69_15945, partial [Gallionellaceae bacterium]|nr:hypothetical protein [Gallionellaceae bacterium]